MVRETAAVCMCASPYLAHDEPRVVLPVLVLGRGGGGRGSRLVHLRLATYGGERGAEHQRLELDHCHGPASKRHTGAISVGAIRPD